ncbi:insulinase family protein [Candidatus Falkowbacteria bacterium]|nr:insulinase family protein [Candidatus Falkowbacteria bacterium]
MFKKFRYPNKIRLLMIPSRDTKAVTVLFLFGVGSRYESKDVNGVSHFIEHLMFKGTKKRQTTLDISKEVDRVGAEFNAMTSKDYTGYFVKVDQSEQALAIDVLSDILLNSTFLPKEINRERGVIVEEINMYHDNPIMHIESLLEEAIYQGSSLAREVCGPRKVIKSISREKILDFKNKYYAADNLVIAIAGKIDKKTKSILEKKFINKIKPKENFSKRIFTALGSKQDAPRIKLHFRKTRQAQIALGFPAYGYNDPRAYGLHLLSIVLGGNMSSRLFTAVREKSGLCYFIRCFPNFYEDCGDIIIQSGLDVSRIEEAMDIISRELKRIKTAGVTAKELRNAKEFLRGKIILNLEDSSNSAEYYAKQELLQNKILTPEEKMKKYQAVTRKQLRNIAAEIFTIDKFNLATIGPFKSKKYFSQKIKL